MKTCSKCGLDKAPEEFNQDAKKADGLQTVCRGCTKSRSREYFYGIDQATFEATLLAQCGVCAVCDTPFTDESVPHVDHDHTCCPGRFSCGACVRALLCGRCNKFLGLIDDCPDILGNALEYLSRRDVALKHDH